MRPDFLQIFTKRVHLMFGNGGELSKNIQLLKVIIYRNVSNMKEYIQLFWTFKHKCHSFWTHYFSLCKEVVRNKENEY